MTIRKIACASALLAGLLVAGQARAESYAGVVSLRDQQFDSLTVSGVTRLSDVATKRVDATGPVAFTNLTVAGPLTVRGTFSGTRATVDGDVNVLGPLSVTQFTAKANSDVTGPFVATDSHFADLTVTSDKVDLANCKVKDIVIRKGASGNAQTLTLRRGPYVVGDITFESGNGQVVMEHGAYVGGYIKGAQVKAN